MSQTPNSVVFRLNFSIRGRERRVLLFEGANLIGNSPQCEVQISEPSVSRRHATIFVANGDLGIKDWASKNGTFVGDRKVRQRRSFEVGQPVRFGEVLARVEVIASSETEAAIEFGQPDSHTSSTADKVAVGQTTLAGVPLHRFVIEDLPAILMRITEDQSPTLVAQLLGEAMVSNLGTESIEIVEDRHACRGVLFAGGRSPDDSAVVLEATAGDLQVRLGVDLARAEHSSLISIVASLLRLSTGHFDSRPVVATEAMPAPMPDPPTLDPRVTEIYRQAENVARGEIGVLILGESGTGKEVLARYLHRSSPRRDGPFVAVNCAALPKDLIESELFGIEKGVATGVDARSGKFEQASGGTLFLDEIGDMHPDTQVSILRVLQEGEVHRVGSKGARQADVRILAATNRNLEGKIEDQTFRLDLYHRIADWEVKLPALRDRWRDIANLAAYFLESHCGEHGVRARGISRAALDRLQNFDWPGNIRQLEREIARSVLFLSDGDLLETRHLSETLRQHGTDSQERLKQRLENFEQREIERALERNENRVADAAQDLGMATSTLYRRIKDLGFDA